MTNDLISIEQKKQEIDYYRGLAAIASKSSSKAMSIEEIMNIMLTAKDLGISPMKAINGGFYILNGKISMSTALMTDRIRKEGHSIKITEWTSKVCTIIGIRKDNNDSVKFEYTWEDATLAGLINSPTWKKFPKQMLYNRAMSTLARTLFPDVVGSAYSEDEKWDILEVPPKDRPLEDPDCPNASIEVLSGQRAQELEASFKTPEKTSMERKNHLIDYLSEKQIDVFYLDTYLAGLCSQSGKSQEHILQYATSENYISRFCEAYKKELERVVSSEEVVNA